MSSTALSGGGPTTRTTEAAAAPRGTTTGARSSACLRSSIARLAAPRRGRTGRVRFRTPQGRTSPAKGATGRLGRRGRGSPRPMRTFARPSTIRTAGRLRVSAFRTAMRAGRVPIEGLGRRTMVVFLTKAARVAKGTTLAFRTAIAFRRTRPVTTFSSMLGTPTLRSRSPRLLPRPQASLAVEVRRPSTIAAGTPQERVRAPKRALAKNTPPP